DAQLRPRLAARHADRVSTPLTGGPQVGHDRELRRLAVHVERVPELDDGVLAAVLELLQYRGDVEVHRVDRPADRAVLGRVVADGVQVPAKRLVLIRTGIRVVVWQDAFLIYSGLICSGRRLGRRQRQRPSFRGRSRAGAAGYCMPAWSCW